MSQAPPPPPAGWPPPPPRPAAPGEEVVATVIPYRNAPALIAYYLGVFSLIPCIGLLLAIPAVILGVIGLKRARQNPTAKGKAHAWAGIILGGVFGLLWLALPLVLIALGTFAK